MSIPQVRIIRKGKTQRIFIDGFEVPKILKYALESTEMNPCAELTLTILCEIQEDVIDVTNLGSTSKEFIKATG